MVGTASSLFGLKSEPRHEVFGRWVITGFVGSFLGQSSRLYEVFGIWKQTFPSFWGIFGNSCSEKMEYKKHCGQLCTESWHFGFSWTWVSFWRVDSKVDSHLSASPKPRFCSESANQDASLGPDSKPSLFGELETRNGVYRVIWHFATVCGIHKKWFLSKRTAFPHRMLARETTKSQLSNPKNSVPTMQCPWLLLKGFRKLNPVLRTTGRLSTAWESCQQCTANNWGSTWLPSLHIRPTCRLRQPNFECEPFL